jgi:NhaP-type Na+/H+ or K+/H+ antiporter
MVFVIAGFCLGPFGLGLLGGNTSNEDLRVLADLTLALILFADASNADLKVLKRQFRIPTRMLLIGLPGAIALGFAAALVIFDKLSIYEAAILATMLAATDAALGKAVVTNTVVPARLREGLNIESGLNDGICVPVLLFFIALSTAGEAGGETESALRLVAEELGIGIAVGLTLAFAGAHFLRWSHRMGWLSEIWVQVTIVALAFSAFSVADSLHGSGYIAAFSGGLLFGSLAGEHKHRLLLAAESTGETLALLTWLVFGSVVIAPALSQFSWNVILYALLSLTVIRMLPIFLSLTGLGENVASKAFLGWFGPRGLASIVFATIVINAGVPNAELIALVVICTVFISLVAHGMTANPLARWIGKEESTGDSN